MLFQLLAYGVLWVVAPLAVFCAAFWRGSRRAMLAHLTVAILIILLDMRWIMSTGLQPAQTAVGLAIAISIRVFLANLVLLPVSVIALKLRRADARSH
jgi:hypothetical protein